MSILKKALDNKAAKHETAGGTCKTISIGGIDIKVCLDENGEIINKEYRDYAKLTNQ